MGWFSWLRPKKGAEEVVERKKAKSKRRQGKPKPETVQASEVEQDIRLLENASRVDQMIGRVTLEPGQRHEFDVSEGTLAGAMLRDGVLREVGKRPTPPPIVIDLLHRGEAPEGLPPDHPVEQLGIGLYKCPWCSESTNDAVVAQMHILEQHGDVILGYYGETFRARQVVV